MHLGSGVSLFVVVQSASNVLTAAQRVRVNGVEATRLVAVGEDVQPSAPSAAPLTTLDATLARAHPHHARVDCRTSVKSTGQLSRIACSAVELKNLHEGASTRPSTVGRIAQ